MSEAVINTPQQAYFAPPEGVYTNVQSINVHPHSAVAHFLSNASVAPPTPQPGAATGDSAVIPPPQHTTRMAVIEVRLPVKDSQQSGGLGLGMSMSGLRGGNSTNQAGSRSTSGAHDSAQGPSPLMISGALPSPGLEGPDSPILGGQGMAGGRPGTSGHVVLSGPTPLSPVSKRKALSSSFSIPTLSNLGTSSLNGGAQDPTIATSRPSRQFRGTSSSFVRSWEGLPLTTLQLKNLTEANNGRKTVFGFWTCGRSVVWSEIMPGRPKDALARVMFSTPPTCVDVNQHTASHNQIDVLVGFSSGDIFWFDPFAAKYTRLNKSGVITSSPITSILWLPPSPNYSANENHSNLFLSSHADGTMLVWDKDREDWSGFNPTPVPTATSLRQPGGSIADTSSSNGGDFVEPQPAINTFQPGGGSDIIVSRPAPIDKKGQGTTKFNPVSHWRVSKKAITAFAFSPDLQLCATVGDDGCLRIINAAEERLLDTFQGYFGSLTCVSWSPDGRFVVTGGQDDLCTIYAPLEQRLVARCQGHSSWVTGVAWDPWRSDERTMRFASVGEDCKLIMWDLSSAALTRPKAHLHHTHNRRHSLSSQRESMSHLPLSGNGEHRPDDTAVFHPAPRRDDVALLQPVMVKVLTNDLFSGLWYLPEYIITLSRAGQIKQFDRPPELEEGRLLGIRNEFGSSVVALDRRAR